ncbi:MAG: 1-deoxy-D-xylulose-5-phosphate reductoisomerase [Anaerovoracaceae bacterium]
MKKIGILGSTGSIGTQALQIVRENENLFDVKLLSCGEKIDLLSQQIDEFEPEAVVVKTEEQRGILKDWHHNTNILVGDEGLIQAAKGDYDLLLNALVGIAGLAPTYYALKTGKHIALANKETLVAGGKIIMDLSRRVQRMILPVDSEHSAIFQCIQGSGGEKLRRLILTASGGPFINKKIEDLENIEPRQALKHPNWSMGQKISIDSATMMNKGLEVIEAQHLFGASLDKIDVVVHPQSIIHSMIEYADGSIISQMGTADMRTPISYALGFPERIPTGRPGLNLLEMKEKLFFQEPDFKTFKCLELAYLVGAAGGSYPVALNAANEVLVEEFLQGRIKFLDIQRKLEEIISKHSSLPADSIEDILEIDKETRKITLDLLK